MIYHSGNRFTFNVTTAGNDSFYVEGGGQGEDSYKRAACMIILGLMPSEGLEETVDTLKDIYEFYEAPPVKALPSTRTLEVNALIASVD